MKTYTLMGNLIVGRKVYPAGTVFTEDDVPECIMKEVKAKAKSVSVGKIVTPKKVEAPKSPDEEVVKSAKKDLTAAKTKLTIAKTALGNANGADKVEAKEKVSSAEAMVVQLQVAYDKLTAE